MPNKSLSSAEARSTLVKALDSDPPRAPTKGVFRLPTADALREGHEDARRLQTELANAFSPRETKTPAPEQTPAAAPEAKPAAAEEAPKGPSKLGRYLKITSAVVLAVVFGWRPLSALLTPSSVEAVVNARAIVLRAPIDGVVSSAPAPWSSWSGEVPRPTLRIENKTADRARLDDLNGERRRLLDQQSNAAIDLERARADKTALESRLQRFLEGRQLQLQARIDSAKVQIESAKTRVEVTTQQEDVYGKLFKASDTSRSEFQRTRLARAEAQNAQSAAEKELRQTSVELDALKAGRYLGDDYNDVPASAQRLDDIDQRIRELESRQRAADLEVVNIVKRIDDETARLGALMGADVALPKIGRVWESLVAEGEYVSRGQPLIRLLDCSTPEVTATVGESAYNQLHVGGHAKFWPAAGGPGLEGVIENLTGAADASGNFAIAPSSLRKDVRHVTVRVPQMVGAAGCEVGRDGLLTFESDGPDTAIAATPESFGPGLRK
jgi:multidrug resistance efflux pump